MTLERATIAATLALAVIAQATVVGLLVSGWSTVDIFDKFATLLGSIMLPFLIDVEELVLIGMRLMSAIPTQVCDFYCNNMPTNATLIGCNATLGANLDCFIMGIALSTSVSMIACPLGIWLLFYVAYRREQSNKSKTE